MFLIFMFCLHRTVKYNFNTLLGHIWAYPYTKLEYTYSKKYYLAQL